MTDWFQIQILCLGMCLFKLVKPVSNTTGVPESMGEWGNWKEIYEELVAQGRIWDFRDLFIAANETFGSTVAQKQFFGSRDVLECLLSDWKPTEEDESTHLALLDLLTHMALYASYLTALQPVAERYLRAASLITESIMEHHPGNMKTRPFLLWTLAQLSITSTQTKAKVPPFSFVANYHGLGGLSRHSTRTGIPYYVPVHQEQPAWAPVDLPTTSIESLKVVLGAARELQDYVTEACCLGELVRGVSDPINMLEQLSQLQRENQNDMVGYLETCLSKYLHAKDERSKAKLLADLNSFGPWRDPSNLVDPSIACSRDILQWALSPSESNSVSHSINASARYYDVLPSVYQTWLDEYANVGHKPRRQQPTCDGGVHIDITER